MDFSIPWISWHAAMGLIVSQQATTGWTISGKAATLLGYIIIGSYYHQGQLPGQAVRWGSQHVERKTLSWGEASISRGSQRDGTILQWDNMLPFSWWVIMIRWKIQYGLELEKIILLWFLKSKCTLKSLGDLFMLLHVL